MRGAEQKEGEKGDGGHGRESEGMKTDREGKTDKSGKERPLPGCPPCSRPCSGSSHR